MRNIACTIILITSLSAAAQTTTSNVPAASNTISTNVVPGLMNDNPSKVFGSVNLGYNSNLYERDAFQSKTSTTADLLVNYRLSGSNVLRAFGSATQEHSQGRESKIADGYTAWVNDGFWSRGKVATIGQQVRLAVPMSRESVKRDEKLTGVTVAPMAVINLTPVGIIGAMLIFQPAVTKNFHKYEMNRAFKTNNEYTFSQLIRAVWGFTERAYLLSDFIYRKAWSYGGTQKNDTTSYSFSVGYNFTNALSASTGITTDSTIRNFQNGSDQNIELFNQNTSSVFLGLTYVF